MRILKNTKYQRIMITSQEFTALLRANSVQNTYGAQFLPKIEIYSLKMPGNYGFAVAKEKQ